MTLSPDAAEALDREARRIYARYATEFVEALSLCPWAARARQDGHVEVEVVLESDANVEAALRAFEALTSEPHVEVGLVVFPRLTLDRRAFEAFVSRLREQDAARQGGSPAMAAAAFHPDARADLTTAARLVPFIRRSPDPTIQLVRLSVLDAVRRPRDMGTAFLDPSTIDLRSFITTPVKPLLHERVAETNLEQLQARGVDAAEAILEDIQRDRDASYARILESP